MASGTDRQQEDVIRRLVVAWVKGDGNVESHLVAKSQHPNTCEWLFQLPTFEMWLKANESTSLLFTAPPGAGKTVTAAAVARHLQDRGYRTILFNFSFYDPSRKNVISALRCLALDLLSHHDSVPDAVRRLYESDIRNDSIHLNDVGITTDIVKVLVSQISRVHIILDGLDECRDRTKLLPVLETLLKSPTNGIAKYFLTSRPERDICHHLGPHSVYTLESPIKSIRDDIKLYMHDNCPGPNQMQIINRVIERSEANFLWATMMLQVCQNNASSSEETMRAELESFPRDLNGLYLRVLHRLSKRKRSQQELARKIFAFLLISIQPLRLSELSHALAIATARPPFHWSETLPKPSLIEDLCSGLVVFDHFHSGAGRSHDPHLRFTHKSVYDFFSQSMTDEEKEQFQASVDTAGMADEYLEEEKRAWYMKILKKTGARAEIEPFFTSVNGAHKELGEACIQYLMDSRYSKLFLQLDSVHGSDHALLKYAAAFWYLHLGKTRPTTSLADHVETFMSSPNFWNCISVQSSIAPYLYAVYHERHGSIKYKAYGPRSTSETAIYYGSPVPQWLNTPRVEDFDAFIAQWFHVLNSHPGYLNHCHMDNDWISRWPNASMQASRRVLCRTIPSDNMTWDDKMVAEMKKKKNNCTGTNGIGSTMKSNGSLPIHPMSRIPTHQCLTPHSLQCQECLVTAYPDDIGKETTPIPPSHTMDSTHSPFEWQIIDFASNMDSTTQSQAHSPTAVALQWKSTRAQVQAFDAPRSQISVQQTSNLNQTDEFPDIHPHHSSSLPSDSESDSESDSDWESDGDSAVIPTTVGMTTYKQPRPSHKHCFHVVQENTEHISYVWSSAYRNLTTRGAFHPAGRWVCWTPSAHIICWADMSTGSVEKTTLPEPAVIGLESAESLHKELCFSQSGSHLYYLVLAATPLGKGVRYNLSITALEMVYKSGCAPEISSSGLASSLSYTAADEFGGPMALTAWTPDHIYLTLPPLASKPKVLRLPLSQETLNGEPPIFQTMKEPIFFPASTPSRHPRLSFISQPDRRGQLVLTLAAEPKHSISYKDDTAANLESCESFKNPNIRQNAVEMVWSITQQADWREWDLVTDTEPDHSSSNIDQAIRLLRGSYVSPDQAFSVSIRSSLGYHTKAFISCF